MGYRSPSATLLKRIVLQRVSYKQKASNLEDGRGKNIKLKAQAVIPKKQFRMHIQTNICSGDWGEEMGWGAGWDYNIQPTPGQEMTKKGMLGLVVHLNNNTGPEVHSCSSTQDNLDRITMREEDMCILEVTAYFLPFLATAWAWQRSNPHRGHLEGP